MNKELIITIESDGTVIATLDLDGEFHEENLGVVAKKDLKALISTLEIESGIEATVIEVTDRYYK